MKRDTQSTDAISLEPIPIECRAFASLPEDARDDIVGWNQALSLAACLQDASVARVTDPDELEAMVDAYARALEVPTMIDVGALEYGPGPIQLRAAYQVAMLHVTLIVRARSSIVAPPDLATNPEAALRVRRLHAQLEPLLAHSAQTAWVAFAVIDRAVEEEPGLASDPVTKNVVRSARAMLKILPIPAREQLDRREPALSARSRDIPQTMQAIGEPAGRQTTTKVRSYGIR
jgi:hypothetical protein